VSVRILNKKFIKGIVTTGLAACIAAGCARQAEAPPSPNLTLPVSINALMVTLIDHSAHYVWDYGYLSAERELTEQEWQVAEYYSVQLAASGPLIQIGGTGALDDTWSADAKWQDMSNNMSKASLNAIDAIRDRDSAKLVAAGEQLVRLCEACHDSFKPDVPTEGIMHNPEYDHLYHLLPTESDE